MKFAELHPGQVIEAGPYRLSQDEVLAFARQYDPQWFHTDVEQAAGGRYGGLIASGWQTCGIAMRLAVDAVLKGGESFGSPGVAYVRWPAPVRPGDELRLKATVLETRRASKNPELGILRWRWQLFNQQGAEVLDSEATSLFDLKDAVGTGLLPKRSDAPVANARIFHALYQEHESISAVLHALDHLAGMVGEGRKVDPKVFSQILYYLDVFPERFHHPKEDAVLFATLKARTHEADALVARLEQQHQRGEQAIRNLEQAMLRWQAGGAAERDAFVAAARTYVERYREHMRLEEDELMPYAKRALSSEDWREVEQAFAAHQDPLDGIKAETDPDELFRRILYLAPPPIGMGPPAA